MEKFGYYPLENTVKLLFYKAERWKTAAFAGTSPPPPTNVFPKLRACFSRKRECYSVGAHSSREMRNRQRRLGAADDSGRTIFSSHASRCIYPVGFRFPRTNNTILVSSRTINDVSVCAQNKQLTNRLSQKRQPICFVVEFEL